MVGSIFLITKYENIKWDVQMQWNFHYKFFLNFNLHHHILLIHFHGIFDQLYI
jgi:hypothetical protein